jgi:predicted phage terminase large subunit-like protein
VSLVKAPGNVALIEEMRDFPNGTHDDQVDALSRAFAALITRQAMNISSEALRRI